MTDIAPTAADWSSILAGVTSIHDADELIARSSQQAEAALEADPELEDELMELTEKRLSGPLDPDTYQGFWELLKGMLGEEGAYLVHFYFMAREQPEARTAVEAAASQRVLGFMRRLTVRFAPELDAAFQIWQELPNAWKTLNREVYYDVIRGRHYVRLLLQKLNGEETVIEGTADSILGLTRSFLVTLRWMQSADAFSQGAIDLFLDDAEPLLAMLKREQEGDGAGEVAGSDGTGGEVRT
jgi:hypothetical protein